MGDEWEQEDDGDQVPAGGELEAVRILRPVARGKCGSPQAGLHALPTLPQEFQGANTKREQAYRAAWSSISAGLDHVLEASNQEVFTQLADFAFEQHTALPTAEQSCTPAQQAVNLSQGRQRIPTALLVAGGINGADHSHTFADLTALLQQKGCYAAHLTPLHLGPADSLAMPIDAIYQQWTGQPCPRPCMQSLINWYEATVPNRKPSKAPPTPAAATASGQHRRPGQPQPKSRSSTGMDVDGAAEEARKPSARETRSTAKRHTNHAAASSPKPADYGSDSESHEAAQQASGSQQNARRGGTRTAGSRQEAERQLSAATRPLVVVVEGTESSDPTTLHDLIIRIKETRTQLPITLVLGLATSGAALEDMLLHSRDGLRAMERRTFRLAPPLVCLERVFGEVLLGNSFPGVYFGPALMAHLDEQFMLQDFTVNVFRRGLQAACMHHFQTQPLSFLAAAVAQGPVAAKAACGSLSKEGTAASSLLVNGKRIRGRELADILETLALTWSGWAVTLQWIAAIAAFVGITHNSDYTLRCLYVDAMRPDFLAFTGSSGGRRPLVAALAARIEKLGNEKSQQLAALLLERAAGVWRGEVAAAEQLWRLQALLQELPVLESPPPLDLRLSGVPRSAPAAATLPTADAAAGSAEAEVPLQQPATDAVAQAVAVRAPAGRASRRGLLLATTRAAAEQLPPAPGSAAPGSPRSPQPAAACSLGAQLAQILLDAAQVHLEVPPCSLAGAQLLCCNAVGAVKRLISSAPRLAVHAALAEPATYLPGLPRGLGVSPDLDDACIAYKLFLEYGESFGVATWFHDFCAVFDASSADTEGPQRPRAANRRRVRANKGVKAPPTAGRGKPPAGKAAQPEPVTVGMDQKLLSELAIRFSQATGELQVLGLLRAATAKRTADQVQKRVFHYAPDPVEAHGIAEGY